MEVWLVKRPAATGQRLRHALEAAGRGKHGLHIVSGCSNIVENFSFSAVERDGGNGRRGGEQAVGGWIRVVTTEIAGAEDHVRLKSCADLFIDSLEVGVHSADVNIHATMDKHKYVHPYCKTYCKTHLLPKYVGRLARILLRQMR